MPGHCAKPGWVCTCPCRYTGYSCPKDTYPCDDKTVCLKCSKGYVLNKANACEEPCKDGYESVTCSAGKFCVKVCPVGFYPYGE
jgi:hypothetical protein